MAEAAYDSVGILGSDQTICTATLVDIPGYYSQNNMPVIVTAGHCIKDEKRDVMTFVTDYIDRKTYTLKTYTSGVLEGTYRFSNTSDFAVLILDTPMPQDIIPAVLDVDYEPIMNNKFLLNSRVSIAGFSADRFGLTEHENCTVLRSWPRWQDSNLVLSTCDSAAGASGGPVITDKTKSQLTIVGTLSFGFPLDFIIGRSGYHDITPSDLDNIPFLFKEGEQPSVAPSEPEETPNVQTCVAANVNTQLNVREGAGTDFKVVASVSAGTVMAVLQDVSGWTLVELDNGMAGYVASRYTKPVPCL